MADRPIRDFVFVCGNNVDEELDTFHLFTIIDDPKIKNGRKLCRLNAKDVPVRISGGMAFINSLRGKPTILGGMDLDKVREASFNENLFFSIKDGSPSDYLVFPDSFNQLPESLKAHPYFGLAFRIAYLAMQSDSARRQLLEESGLQETEILDKLSQSRTQENKYIQDTIESFNRKSEASMRSEVEGESTKQDGQGFY